jgi:uncharacterized caspase-like protein
MRRHRLVEGAVGLLLLGVLGSGCSIRLGPEAKALQAASRPPLLRLGEVTETHTGTWSVQADTHAWGSKYPLIGLLRQGNAATLFTNDPDALVVDIRLVSDHADDTRGLALMSAMSIASLGIIPLRYHSEWETRCDVSVRSPRGSRLADYSFAVKGTYDIWTFPLTMFSMAAAGLHGDEAAKEIRRRMTNNLAAELIRSVEADYPRLAKAKESGVEVAVGPTPGPSPGGVPLEVPRPAPMGAIAKRWAVIVGVSDYKFRGKWGLENLRYAARDAQALAAFLQSEKGGRFDRVTVLTDQEATTQKVKAALREQLRGVQKDDFVVIAWSGHGSPDPHERSRLYLVTYDADPEHLASTAYSMTELREDVAKLQADRVLVVADTCHSAGISDPDLGVRGPKDNTVVEGFRSLQAVPRPGTLGGGPMRLVFTGCESGELSQESAELDGGHGVFSWFLLQALRGDADRPNAGGDGDGTVSVGEMIEFTRDQVKRFSGNQQHPDTAGQFDRKTPMATAR